MIISGEIPDPIDARRDPEAARVIAKLDGKPLDLVVAASAREGWVDVYVKDGAGHLVVTVDRQTPVIGISSRGRHLASAVPPSSSLAPAGFALPGRFLCAAAWPTPSLGIQRTSSQAR